MRFPSLSTQFLLNRLELPTQKVNVVLDTDTYNEVDDQFALAYAIKSSDKLNLEAVYAAPFHNNRSENPKNGMERSYDEILKILDLLNVNHENYVFKGSTDYLKDIENPEESEAVNDLISRAMAVDDDNPLYVVAIGAITNVATCVIAPIANVATAILLQPDIIKKIVVVWLGGNDLSWSHAKEFNLMQDVLAARTVFDSGVPLVLVPCLGVASHLTTTIPELEKCLDG